MKVSIKYVEDQGEVRVVGSFELEVPEEKGGGLDAGWEAGLSQIEHACKTLRERQEAAVKARST